MLLSGIGERVSPRLIEVLSGVGIGAFQSANGLPFFSGLCGLPDQGISAALQLLGFAWEEDASPQPVADAGSLLRGLLAQGPVVIGPLDMQHLAYNPMRPRVAGVDHFVLALGTDGDLIRLHDPAGFAHALLASGDLTAAWNADAIGYRRGHCRFWTRPRRLRPTDDADLRGQAMERFRRLHAEAAALAQRDGRAIDGTLIRLWADQAGQAAFSPPQLGHLTHFALPLGAKRALDHAAFFAGHEPALADLKRQQAIAFGACHSHVVAQAWPAAAEALRELADIEDEIGRCLSL